jgi:hypothetical protein
MNEVMIPASKIMAMIAGTIAFPYPKICKHLVAADLLSLLEEHGFPVTTELAGAVVNADDEVALDLIRSCPMSNTVTTTNTQEKQC